MADNDQAQKPESQTEKRKTKTEKTVKTSSVLAKIIESIEKLSVLELAELVKALEEKFGVSAMAPVAAAPSGTAPAEESQAGEENTSNQTIFNVILTAAGDQKISVIKTVRELNQALGLKEAKDLVESAPKEVLTGVNKETAEEAKKKLEASGAKVELK